MARMNRPVSIRNGLPSRRASLQLITSVLRRDMSLEDAAANSKLFTSLSVRDRAFAWRLTLSCLRHLGEIDKIIDYSLKRRLPKQSHRVHDLLRLGAAQLLFANTPPHAAVNSTVDLVDHSIARYRDLVNAVLRRIVREGGEYIKTLDSFQLNTPPWLWDSWSRAYGTANARQIAAVHCSVPPLDITTKHTVSSGLTVEARRMHKGSLRLPLDGPVTEIPGFLDGLWWVQDLAATFPVKMMGEVKQQRVIDLCAAPGGKAAQLCDSGAKVTSIDISEARLVTLKENLDRLSFAAEIVCADARVWRPKKRTKFVLLDAPCTGTGTIRRHPDILYRRTQKQVERSVQLLDQLLAAASEMLDIGGVLVFSTCSLQPEEGAQRVDSFLELQPGFVREPIGRYLPTGFAFLETKQGDLRTLPSYLSEAGGMDGFFAARLKRIF